MAIRGPYNKGLATRDEILDVALELFSDAGYDRTSVREIARRTGLSQAGLLHHFSSKEALFLEILRRRDQLNERDYTDTHGRPVTVDGLIAIMRHNADDAGLVRLFVTMSAESAKATSLGREFFQQRYRYLQDDIAADIRAHQAEGRVSSTLDPIEVASVLIAAADGLQLQWLLDPEVVDMAGRLQRLWDGISHPSTEELDLPK